MMMKGAVSFLFSPALCVQHFCASLGANIFQLQSGSPNESFLTWLTGVLDIKPPCAETRVGVLCTFRTWLAFLLGRFLGPYID